MSYFDDASLVMIPSGYKTSKVYSVKPTDGTGDLTFSRSNDTATRVNSAGLIEKVRTNLILQSQTLTTTWTTYQAVITSNATTAPDGTTTAEKIQQDTGTLNSVAVQQVTVPLGELTLSAYLKAGTTNLGKLGLNTTNWREAIYDLSNGTIVSLSAGASATIVAAGNGWYRCTLTREGTNTTSYVNVGCTPQVGEYCYAWGCQLEAGVATDYIPTTSAAVSVGPVANVPRLDYLNSSCPRLLLEPQRTNLATSSENLSGAGWSSQGSTITSNATTSPDGYSNADAIVETATTDEHNRIAVTSLTAASHTASVFLKKFNQTWCAVYLFNGTVGIRHWINLDTLTAGTSANIGAGITAPLTLTNYGNGWVRASMTWTADATSWSFYIACARSNGGATTYAGDGTSGLYAWGAQVEAGAYATSYIPTLGAAVTRGADLAQKTSASALIGQTEGTIFWEIQVDTPSATGHEAFLNVDNGAFGDSIYLFKSSTSQLIADIWSGGQQQAVFTKNGITAGSYKCAIAYANNNMAFFVNGTQVGTTDTSCSVPATSRIQLGSGVFGPSTDLTKQVLLFKTRLTNAQLAELTTL